MSKLTSEQLSDVIIESMVLSVALLERFEIMNENDLFVQRAKQSLRNTIPHIEQYVNKLIKVHAEDEKDYFKKGATVISELSSRIDKALKTENILDISTRKQYLKEFIENTTLFPMQKKELYNNINNSGIITY